ncbi:heparinase II/III-family protein [bacterium]|nr:heparinase II/III-family protein [bacterium]
MKIRSAVPPIVIVLCLLSCGRQATRRDSIAIPTGPDTAIKRDGNIEKIAWDKDGSVVWDAPVGDRVLCAFPLPEGVRLDNYGLCKFDIRITGGPVDVMIFIERPGEKHMVYRPIDVNMPRPGWQTIHLDLNQPEIIRQSHFTYDRPGIAFNLWAMNTGYPEQEASRKIEIRNVRLTRRFLDVRWNEVDYSTIPDRSGDLIYEYPVTVYNKDTKSRTVHARLDCPDSGYGTGIITPGKAVLAPGDSMVCMAVLRLPAERLKQLPVLYCEWFMPVFSLEGISDSDESILRSSDRISLPLIIMPRAEIPFALFDSDGLRQMRERYKSTDWGRKEGDAVIAAAEKILASDLTIPDGPGWARAYYYCEEHRCVLQYQGPGKHYCPVGGEYRTVDFEGVDLDRDYRAGEHDRCRAWTRTLALAYALTGDARFSTGALTIINQYRKNYFTYDWLDLDVSNKTIDKGRLHFAKYMETYGFRAMIEALDLLRATGGVPDDEAQGIIRELFLPALTEIADYRMDMLCRQTTITATALIGGLTFNHAPLVAFAARSPYGYFGLRRWGATADGIGHGHGYAQNGYTTHCVEMAEFLYRIGLDTFDEELKRLIDGSFWWSEPMNPSAMAQAFSIAARHYPDPVYRKYASRSLIGGEPPAYRGGDIDLTVPPTVNFPNSGLTILRRPLDSGTLDAEFKWSMPDNRGSFSVMSLGLNFYGYRCQSYPGHFNWGSTDLHHKWQIQSASHTTIVVDRHNQSGMKDYFKGHYMPHPSRQIFFEDGPDAAVTMAYNDRIYPGVRIWRTVCVMDGACLIIDSLRSEAEHTYDWWFHGVPDHSNGREGLSLVLNPRPEPLGNEDGYEMVQNLSSASTDSDFGSDWIIPAEGSRGRLTLSMRALNTAPVEVVHGFEWSYQYRTPEKEFVVLRRDKARNADFCVLLEPHKGAAKLTKYERFIPADEKGNPVDSAIGLNITLSGKSFEIVSNPEGHTVKTVRGTTDKVFSVGRR